MSCCSLNVYWVLVDSRWHTQHFSHMLRPLTLWLLLTFMFLSVSSLCASLSSRSLSARRCCSDSTFLSISCLCSLMATSSWPSWGRKGERQRKMKNAQNAVRYSSKTYSVLLNAIFWCVCVCLCVVPDLLSVGAPPVSPSVHCPCLRPREFSPPTPSGSHCEATRTHNHTRTHFYWTLYQIPI